MNYEYEAAIILAGGVRSDKTLPDIPKARVYAGILLFNQAKTPYLVFSGHFSFMFANPLNLSESEAMKTYTIVAGIPTENIITEDESKDTLGNAYFTKINVVIPHQWKKLVVITSDFHLERTKYLFTKVYGPNFQIDYIGVPTLPTQDIQEKRKESERKQLTLAHEWLDPIIDGDDQKIRELLYTKHPGYAPNPKITTEQLLEKLKTL